MSSDMKMSGKGDKTESGYFSVDSENSDQVDNTYSLKKNLDQGKTHYTNSKSLQTSKLQSISDEQSQHDSACFSMDYSEQTKSHSNSTSNTASDSGFHSSENSSSLAERSQVAQESKPLSSLSWLTLFQRLCFHEPDPSKWEGKRDISYCLTQDEMSKGQVVFWEEVDDEGDFEALNAARDRDDIAVVFAMYLADSWKRLNTQNDEKQTVLHVAAELCSPATVRLLVSRGADGAVADLWGNTPLHIAAKVGRANVIRELTTTLKREELKHPRFKVPYKSLPQDNKDQMNHDGRTPLHLAAQCGYIDCIEALADAKVDMDSRRLGDGYSALHIAIDNGQYDVAQVLLERGADLEVRNHKGETPQQLAYLISRDDLVQLCADHGASPNQLLFAETEQVEYSSDEEMDWSSDYEELVGNVDQLAV